MLKKGKISKIISNTYTVSLKTKSIEVKPRGIFRYKNQTPLVGDNVLVDIKNKTIEKIYPRKNEINRPRVVNVDLALIVSSFKEPKISFESIDRLLYIYESKNITPILVFTKIDILKKEEKKDMKKWTRYYKKLGYKVFLNNQVFFLKLFLREKTVFLSGPSGVGKTTLVNKLNSKLSLKVGEISSHLQRGKHTTRHVELFKVSSFYVIDTPGFSTVDIGSDYENIKFFFREFKTPCEYKNCFHINENCDLIKKMQKNKYTKSRYNSYKKLYMEAYENSSKLFK